MASPILTFSTITWSFSAFAFVFVLQVLASRLVRTRSEDKYIIFLYVLVPLFTFLTILALNLDNSEFTAQLVAAYVLYFVISSSWVASYPAIYAVCPTLVISLYIREKTEGASSEEIRKLLNLKQNSVDRLQDAVSSNLLKIDDNKVTLTAGGRLFANFFIAYRRLLGLDSSTL